MNKKILFTPVGGTDPISETNFHDGPIIHIARHYKPDIICMYMSKEILDNEEADKKDDKDKNKEGRYLYCIRKLGEKLGQTFEIERIERPELEQVQLFDSIYTDFETILDDITGKLNDTDELLLNISSGTPAMKSALLVLATMIDIPCKCIQVNTPEKNMNEHKHDKKDGFQMDLLWELNPDNNGEYSPGDENYNRTHEETLVSLKRLKYEEIIKKFVRSYDYHAALLLAEGMSAEHTKQYFNKLKLADARQKLNFYEVDDLLKNENKEMKEIYSPIRTEKNRKAYEYMLALQAKEAKGEYVDFIRGISPIFTDLLEGILLKHAQFDISDYTYTDDEGVKWDADRLSGTQYIGILNAAYTRGFAGGWVKSDHLVKLIQGLIADLSLRGCVEALRKIEKIVRNPAAHEIVGLSDKKIKEMTGYNCKEIIDLIREAFTYTSYNIKSCYWNSYDAMNDDIISSI